MIICITYIYIYNLILWKLHCNTIFEITGPYISWISLFNIIHHILLFKDTFYSHRHFCFVSYDPTLEIMKIASSAIEWTLDQVRGGIPISLFLLLHKRKRNIFLSDSCGKVTFYFHLPFTTISIADIIPSFVVPYQSWPMCRVIVEPTWQKIP